MTKKEAQAKAKKRNRVRRVLRAPLFISFSSLVSAHLVCLACLAFGISFVLLANLYLVCTLLLRAASVVMRPEPRLPTAAAEEYIDTFLKSAGVEPAPAPPRAGRANAKAIRSPHRLAQKVVVSGDMKAGGGKPRAIFGPLELARNAAAIGGDDVKAGDGVSLCGDETAEGGLGDREAAAEKGFGRSWLGMDLSPIGTLVVLTTALCR